MRLLVAADIHLHAYPHYNLENDPDFRLNQFYRLAHRLVDIYHREKCDGISVAGDWIQVPVIRPKVQHALFKFAKILQEGIAANGGKVFLTVGNHDKDSRSLEVGETTSVVTLLTELDNFEYMDKKVINFGGKVIGFQDFYGQHDLSWIDEQTADGHVDILFNHFTLGNRYFSGQTIDSSKFDVMIFGDIHKPFQKGNMISVGNPIGHRLGDCQDGTVLIVDTDESVGGSPAGAAKTDWVSQFGISYKWVKIIDPGKWDFLRIYRPDDKYVENMGQYKYDVCVEYAAVPDTVASDDSIDLVASLNYEEILAEYLSTDRLKEINGEMIRVASEANMVKPPVDLRFQLMRMEIANYRSVEKAEVVWNGGTMLVQGHLGSGKTSIMRALCYAFFDDREIREQVRNTMPPNEFLYVDLVFKYEGMYYRIDRGYDGSGYLYFWMGDEDEVLRRSYLPKKDGKKSNPEYFQHVGGNTKGDVTSLMKERLKFLEMWRLIYVDQFSSGIMAGMSEVERVNLISRILGWDAILVYNSIASTTVKEEKNKVENVRSQLNVKISSVAALEELGLVRDEFDYDYELQVHEQERDSCNSYVNSYNSYLQKKSSVDTLQKQYDSSGVPKMPEALEAYDSLKISVDVAKKQKDALVRAIEDNNPESRAFKARVARIETAKSQIERLTQQGQHASTGNCHACGQEIHDHVVAKRMEDARQLQMTNAQAELTTAEQDHKAFADLLSTYGGQLSVATMILTNTVANITKMEAQISEVDDYRKEVNRLATLKQSLDAAQSVLGNYVTTDPEEAERCRKRSAELGEEIGSLKARRDTARDNNAKLVALETMKGEIVELEASVVDAEASVKEYEEYLRLTSISGPVVRSVLEECAKLLSNEKIEVRTTKTLASGESRPDLSLNMKVGPNWINYKHLSGGQLMTADLIFLLSLIKIAGGSGLLILDETFKYFNSEQIDEIGALIKDCAARDRMIITHAESFVYADRVLLASMDDEGISHYEVRDLE